MRICVKAPAERPETPALSLGISASSKAGEACETDRPETEALLRELERVNRILGVYRSMERTLIPWCAAIARRQGSVRLVDIGCGSGGLLLRLGREFNARGIQAHLLGLDPNPAALRCARRNQELQQPPARSSSAEIAFEFGTLQDLPRASADLVVSTFVLHHLPDATHLEAQLCELRRVASHGTFHLDFREHPPRLFTSVWMALLASLGCSQALRLDGARSVERAWTARELTEAACAAGWKPNLQGALGICRTVRGEFLHP